MLEDKSGAELGLAPCPFCGSDSEHIWLRHKNVHRSSTCTEIQCECCGAIGPVWSAVELDGEEYDAEIIAQWNRTNEPTVKLPLSASPQARGEGDGGTERLRQLLFCAGAGLSLACEGGVPDATLKQLWIDPHGLRSDIAGALGRDPLGEP